jgi:hypothetical protein
MAIFWGKIGPVRHPRFPKLVTFGRPNYFPPFCPDLKFLHCCLNELFTSNCYTLYPLAIFLAKSTEIRIIEKTLPSIICGEACGER